VGKIEREIVEALVQIPEFVQIETGHLGQIQENAYCLDTQPRYFIKVISDNDRLGQNELRVHQGVLATASIPRPDLVYQIKLPGITIACWEWLEGADLRTQRRDLLPEAFEQLGLFHAQQRHAGQVESPITQRVYDTVQRLVEAEILYLARHHEEQIRKAAGLAGSLLGTGYATVIHGDMHPGNLHLTGQGLKFVDWGYCIPSLNLFDLGYIETIEFYNPDEEMPWWIIRPDEARSVLPAYYAAFGLGGVDYDLVQLAVMFWSRLWAYENCVKFKNKLDAAKSRKQLVTLASLM
jgi:hypothetical protein